MKIIKYESLEDIELASLEFEPIKMIYKTDISHSFRIYDTFGNTLQFHVYYIK
jgi:hypothetical protein